MTGHSEEYLVSLVTELRKLPKETEWVEFKHNYAEPQGIGEYVSALSNSAALEGKANGYLLWGIDDKTHEVLGTEVRPTSMKVGDEELENWLVRLTSPRLNLRFYEFTLDGKSMALIEVPRAAQYPVRFGGDEYIRVGSYKQKLKDHPQKEKALWRVFEKTPFEKLVAVEGVSGQDVLKLLDYGAYFDLLGQDLPGSPDRILEALAADSLITRTDAAKWNISNLGAVLFAKRLPELGLDRKAVRVIAYKGDGRVEVLREQAGVRGYAIGFDGLIEYVNALIPSNEVIERALRRTVPMYPELAVRELVANALIHQDLFVTGAGPTVEIFANRMEITSPGEPLVSTERFLDNPPRSRNEGLASLMRRIGVCEERGSGIDKVVFQTELYQLPAPTFEVVSGSMRATLYSHRPLTKMDRADRIRACYQHACLKRVNQDYLTNASLRERFGIETRNSAMASRLIKEAVEAEAIFPHDPNAAPKMMKYVPWWATGQT